jgi:prepilin-type N-terminal cleavage/methylation domain-containing protein
MLLLYCEHSMDRKGFTLIELIMVMVLLGIMAAVVVPRLGNMTTTNAAAFPAKLRADIRYAQNLAMTRGKRTRVYFNGTGPAPVTAPAQGYSVGIDNSGTGNCSSFTLASDPAGGGNMLVTLNTGMYTGITIPAPSITCLEYDSLGRPYACGAGACATVPLAATMTADVNGNASMRVSVTIQTGVVN